MCGIVGFTGKTEVVPFLLECLEQLEYRGYDSAGIAVLKNGKLKVQKTLNRIESLKQKKESDEKLSGDTAIGHTRWATHGEPSVKNAHPIVSANGKFAVVHNGIIENYLQLKEKLQNEGFEFSSETDTEVVAVLLQKYYNGDLKMAVTAMTKCIKGSFALGIMCTDYPDTIVAVKNFSPLIIGLAEDTNIIASDVAALAEHTKKAIYIKDGNIAFITARAVEIYDEYGLMTEPKITNIDWNVEKAQKCGYEHFMLKEIMEQPNVVENVISKNMKCGEISFEGLKLSRENLEKFNKITIIGCGSAFHAGIVGRYVFEELLRLNISVELASEFRYGNPLVDSNTLIIAISQSGETADTLAALKEAKKRGGHTLSIVNVVGSSIANESDDVIYTDAGPEIAVATTKAYSAQLVVLYLLGVWLSEQSGRANEKILKILKEEIVLLPQKIRTVLNSAEKIRETAKRYSESRSVFFIGRNIDYAVALEAALKLKEISYIHSEGYAAGELKHGTISLIEKGTTVIAVCGCKSLLDKTFSAVKEVAARGAEVLLCGAEDDLSFYEDKKSIINIPKTEKLFLGSIEIIPFQLYAYYTAFYRGCDIDKPRNLAKSVTVE